MAGPKERYIDFLPALYQKHDAAGTQQFLETYLQIFQAILGRYPHHEDEDTLETPASIPRKGMARVLDVSPDLFYPRLSFLFRDSDDFIPPLTPQRQPYRNYTDEKYAELNSYFGITEPQSDQSWQAGVIRWLSELLDWQAEWLGLQADDNWSLDKKRLVLARIMPVFRKRGTARGLEELLRIFVDPAIDVIEKVDAVSLRVGETTRLVETFEKDDAVVGGARPYSFAVQLTLSDNDTESAETRRKIAAIEGITDREKPVKTTYRVILKTPPPETSPAT